MKGIGFMRFRKKDYIIFYAITVIIYLFNLVVHAKVDSIIAIFVGAIFPSITLGTITNVVFIKR